MSRKNEPTLNDLLQEIEGLKKTINFYEFLSVELADYLYHNGNQEHAVEHLLLSGYTPFEIYSALMFNKEMISRIARLHGIGIEQDI